MPEVAGPDAGVYPVVEDDEAEQWQEAGHHQPGPVDVVPEGANWRFLTRVFPSVLNVGYYFSVMSESGFNLKRHFRQVTVVR